MKLIQSVQDLKKIRTNNKKYKIVLCHGVFDLLHIGHINHFKESRKHGNILVVSITSDRYVNKGPGRPRFKQTDRANAISELVDVDYVFINNSLTASNVIKYLKPNIYSKGKDYKIKKNDYTRNIYEELKIAKKNKCKVIFTKSKLYSSSNLLNSFNNNIDSLSKKLISKIKNKANFNKIKKIIDINFNKNVTIIGETIIDQYVFCETIGKSGKEPMLVLKENKSEYYVGGVLAIANHLSDFFKKVSVLSMIGEKNGYLNLIKKQSKNNLNSYFIKKKNSPTILKKRFLDEVNNSKVLGVYNLNDEEINNNEENKFLKKLKSLKNTHCTIISDYGHGLITKSIAKYLCKSSNFIALNAQINSSNIGIHSMRKYKNIDLYIINEKEIRHEFRDKVNKIEILMKKISKEQNINIVVVTRGLKGSVLYSCSKNSYFYCGALANEVKDKVGAGDAMLAIIAISLASGLNEETSLFLGSLAAIESLKNFANKSFVNKTDLLRSAEYLLK